MTCKLYPNDIMSAVFCEVKYINRNNIKINVWANFSQPIYECWAHALVYYRFNGLTYQRFPIELWENVCGWFAGTSKSYLLDWTFGRVLQYTNMNHPCPYENHAYVKIDNISMNHFFIEQFLPAGKFRIDVNLTNTYKGAVLAMASIFFSVSDLRIEKFW